MPICNIGSVADADILRDLREQVLDETQSVAGLLRKCLALGTVTGSEELRAWAAHELRGYPAGEAVPKYRHLYAQLLMSSVSGQFHATGQQIDRLLIPEDLREFVPERLELRHPVEELAGMASRGEPITMSSPTFPIVCSRWSRQLPMFQDVLSLNWSMLPSSIAGIVDNVRTTLVEIVMDLAKDVPLNSLPSRARVDGAVQVHINSNDNNSINVAGSNSGIIGLGTGSTQIQNNSVSKELVDLVTALRAALPQIDDEEQRADAEQAIDDFEESVSEDNPDPVKVKRRWAWLERAGATVGNAVLNQAITEGTPVVMEHLQALM